MTGEIAKYRVVERLSIRTLNDRHPRVFDVGAEVSFPGKPGPALLPLNGSACRNKLRALLDGPGPHHPVAPVRMARSLGFEGHEAGAAKIFIDDWIQRETARQNATSMRVSILSLKSYGEN
jgi:hypothetical protein